MIAAYPGMEYHRFIFMNKFFGGDIMAAITNSQGTPEQRGTYLDACKTWAFDHKVETLALAIISIYGASFIPLPITFVAVVIGLVLLSQEIPERSSETLPSINDHASVFARNVSGNVNFDALISSGLWHVVDTRPSQQQKVDTFLNVEAALYEQIGLNRNHSTFSSDEELQARVSRLTAQLAALRASFDREEVRQFGTELMEIRNALLNEEEFPAHYQNFNVSRFTIELLNGEYE